jgi:hypothetical protein
MSHPEGSIAHEYIFDEIFTFYSRYLHECETKFNREPRRSENTTSIADADRILRTIGSPPSNRYVMELVHISWIQAQRHVLVSYPLISR